MNMRMKVKSNKQAGKAEQGVAAAFATSSYQIPNGELSGRRSALFTQTISSPASDAALCPVALAQILFMWSSQSTFAKVSSDTERRENFSTDEHKIWFAITTWEVFLYPDKSNCVTHTKIKSIKITGLYCDTTFSLSWIFPIVRSGSRLSISDCHGCVPPRLSPLSCQRSRQPVAPSR